MASLPIRVLFLLALSPGAGCADRIEVVPRSGDGGAGGATSSVATTGAAGGSRPPACSLIHAQTALLAADPSGHDEADLLLTAASLDGYQVAAVAAQQVSPVPLELHTGFRPWDAWPANGEIGPMHDASIEHSPVGGWAAARSRDGRFALLSRAYHAMFAPELVPDADGTGDVEPYHLAGVQVMFLAARAPGLAGPTHFAGARDFLSVRGELIDASSATHRYIRLGCADADEVGGAEPFEDGWIAAFASGEPPGHDCGGAFGPPRYVDVVRVAADGSRSTLASLDDGAIASMRTAAHPDGLFVVWTTSAHGAARVRAARVIGATGEVIGPVDVAPGGASGAPLAVASLGRAFGLVRSSAGTVVVEVYDEGLARTAATSFAPSGAFAGPLAALGSPAGDSLIAGWTRTDMAPTRIEIARFDCVN